MKWLGTVSTLTVAFHLVVGTNPTALAQSFDNLGERRYLYRGTFALELMPSGNSYRIVTYLPPTTLVFYHPEDSQEAPTVWNGYHEIMTQFGQRLLVSKKEISKVNFKTRFGTQEIIFNLDFCPTWDKKCKEGPYNKIKEGNVLDITLREKEFYHLSAKDDKGETENYVIPLFKKKIDQLESGGVLTDATKPHPEAIHIQTFKVDSLKTECGEVETRKRVELIGEELGLKSDPSYLLENLPEFLKKTFNITTEQGASKIILKHGGAGIAREYRVIMTKRRGKKDELQRLYLSLRIKCIGPPKEQNPAYIQSATVHNYSGLLARIESDEFYELPEDTTPSDKELKAVYFRNGQRAFMTSISRDDDYRRAIGVLKTQAPDLDISQVIILLSELNATCNNKQNGNKTNRDICREELPPIRQVGAVFPRTRPLNER